jgi:hypothetical protein
MVGEINGLCWFKKCTELTAFILEKNYVKFQTDNNCQTK